MSDVLASSNVELPAPWQEHQSNGQTFYWHATLGVSTWYKPLCHFTPPWLPYEYNGMEYFYNMESPSALPVPWEEHARSDATIFYWNPEMQLSCAYKPVGTFSPPWQGFESDKGLFYCNTENGQSSWHKPVRQQGLESDAKNFCCSTESPEKVLASTFSRTNVWSNGRRATLVSYSNKELRHFLHARGTSSRLLAGCVERADLFKLAEEWVEAQDTPPDLEKPLVVEFPSARTSGLFDLLSRAPIAYLFWQHLPLQGPNVCQGRAMHPLSSSSRAGSALANQSCCLFSESDLVADVLRRWQTYENNVYRASLAYCAEKAASRERAPEAESLCHLLS